MTLKVYHSYTQPKGENLCRLRLDRCSHLCVPEPRAPYLPHNMSRDTAKREASPTTTTLEDGGTTCLCPANLRLAANGAACVEGKCDFWLGARRCKERGKMFNIVGIVITISIEVFPLTFSVLVVRFYNK